VPEPHSPELDVGPDSKLTAALERVATDLARTAGEHIRAAYAADLNVGFKQPRVGAADNSNPVSRIDREVEELVRARLARDFPDHGIIGEELPPAQGTARFTWVIDPVDGTTNFINGLPLFACSIGVLHRGHPVAGAIWCASTHTFRPGTYHANAAGNSLCFDGKPLARRAPGTWRGLAAEPGTAPTYASIWDTRVLGCATVEFAYVAAGLLRIAYIPHPQLWDAAAGLSLLRAAGCQARVRRGGRWETMLYFPADEASYPQWSEPLLIGSKSDLERALT
jgi:myo-inositol-1(or 4)-monophosphatase